MNAKAFLPLLLVAAAASVVPLQQAVAQPPDWAPAHGQRAKHEYVYYPVAEVYYEPARDLWFWLDGDDWRQGSSLPIPYRQYTQHGVSVQLDSERPYERHEQVVKQHGRGVSAVRSQGRGAADERGPVGDKDRGQGQRKHKQQRDKREGQGGKAQGQGPGDRSAHPGHGADGMRNQDPGQGDRGRGSSRGLGDGPGPAQDGERSGPRRGPGQDDGQAGPGAGRGNP